MESQLLRLGLSATFIEAVDGNTFSKDFIEKKYNSTAGKELIGRELATSEVGCYLSHIKVYQHIVGEKLQNAIVLEDDVEILPRFKDFLKSVETLDDTIEYVNLANYPNSSRFFSKEKLGSFTLCKHVAGIWGTYGYYISSQGANKILMQSQQILMPIDYIGRLYGDKLNSCVVHPYCVSTVVDQLSSESIFSSIIAEERRKLEDKTHIHPVRIKLSHFKYSVLTFLRRFS